ncbi:2OG-Fe(II) oxygenase [Variovorax sp. RHLX14]|uniref:2OG-Fe(II) oxygenase n=1 Tax=Variovorax sp. RHLX14 TaxID=1259731 RepID=UPI003F48E485
MQPPFEITSLGAGILTIDNFLSVEECQNLIQHSEAIGYEQAAIRTDEGDRVIKDIRNNDRVIFDDMSLAGQLFERAKPFLIPEKDGWILSRMNERFRFYRYIEKQKFAWHLDGTVTDTHGDETFLTFMMYLNDDFEGGSTDFNWEKIEPKRGRALVFPHRLRHQGSPVSAGSKYVLRTDVFFSMPSTSS